MLVITINLIRPDNAHSHCVVLVSLLKRNRRKVICPVVGLTCGALLFAMLHDLSLSASDTKVRANSFKETGCQISHVSVSGGSLSQSPYIAVTLK